jgi:chromosome segregation ATPase
VTSEPPNAAKPASSSAAAEWPGGQDAVLARDVAELREISATQRAELRELRGALLHLEASEARRLELEHEASELRGALLEASGRLEERQQHVARLERVLAGMSRSASWRATRPLRVVKGFVGGRSG